MGPTHLPTDGARDLRWDFIRGLALFTIFIDHNRWLVPFQRHWLSDVTFGRFSFMDAADVFFFLSGFVSGLVYTKTLHLRGFAACQKKALRRSFELYATQAALCLVCFALLQYASGSYAAESTWAHYLRANASPWAALLNALKLGGESPIVEILSDYIIFIALAPLALCLLRRSRWLFVLLSLGVYAAAQGAVTVDHARRAFNPLAWQAIFFAGLFLGHAQATGQELWRPSAAVVAASAAGLVLIAAVRLAPGNLAAWLLHTDALAHLIPRELPLTGKHNLEPLRMFNLALWVMVVPAFGPAARMLRTRAAAVAIRCGQQSLAVFSAGIILNYVGVALLGTTSAHLFAKVVFTVLGCGVLVLTALLWQRLKAYRPNLAALGKAAEPERHPA